MAGRSNKQGVSELWRTKGYKVRGLEVVSRCGPVTTEVANALQFKGGFPRTIVESAFNRLLRR